MNRFIRQKLAEIEKNQRSDYRLGYSFEPKGLSIAPKTLANFLDRIAQLYEQGADVRRIGQYVRNLWRWVIAGVDKVMIVPIDMLIRRRYGEETY